VEAAGATDELAVERAVEPEGSGQT